MNIYFPPSLSVVIIPFVVVSQQRGSTWTKVLLLATAAAAAVMEREKYLTHMRVQHASCMPVAAHHVMQHIYHHPQKETDPKLALLYTRYAGYLCNNRIIRSLQQQKPPLSLKGCIASVFLFFLPNPMKTSLAFAYA